MNTYYRLFPQNEGAYLLMYLSISVWRWFGPFWRTWHRILWNIWVFWSFNWFSFGGMFPVYVGFWNESNVKMCLHNLSTWKFVKSIYTVFWFGKLKKSTDLGRRICNFHTCESHTILSLRFYVKSFLENLEVLKLPLSAI